MLSIDLAYFQARAAAEHAIAAECARPDVAAIHEELARQYEALIQWDDPAAAPLGQAPAAAPIR
jgi:hypothetical protein